MPDRLTQKARYLAYRWYRNQTPQASHSEGWIYARSHWNDFLPQAKELLAHLPEEKPDADLGLLLPPNDDAVGAA
jgi:hypothetical protein